MLWHLYLFEIAYLKERADANETALVVPHDLVDVVVFWIGEGVHKDCKHQLISRQPVKIDLLKHTLKLLASGLELQVLFVARIRDVCCEALDVPEVLDVVGLHELYGGAVAVVFVRAILDGPIWSQPLKIASISTLLVARPCGLRRGEGIAKIRGW